MLSKSELRAFIKEVESAYQFFCLWKYMQNKNYNEIYERYLNGSVKYKNFWSLVYVGTQNEFCIAIARLTDQPRYQNKFDNVRLSVCYIIENSPHDLKKEFKRKYKDYAQYIQKMKTFRIQRLAHSDKKVLVNGIKNIIPANSEDFFDFLKYMISKIIESDQKKFDFVNINLTFWDDLTKRGLESIMDDLIQIKQ